MANPRGNPQNLRPFPKGRSGNPRGRPKLPDLKKVVAKVLAEEKDGTIALEAILKALRAKATRGDTAAASQLLDRAYGKPKQQIDATSDGKPLAANQTIIIGGTEITF